MSVAILSIVAMVDRASAAMALSSSATPVSSTSRSSAFGCVKKTGRPFTEARTLVGITPVTMRASSANCDASPMPPPAICTNSFAVSMAGKPTLAFPVGSGSGNA